MIGRNQKENHPASSGNSPGSLLPFISLKKISIKELGGGLTNHVFEVSTGKDQFVIRINEQEQRDKTNFFHKEQWADSKYRARLHGALDLFSI